MSIVLRCLQNFQGSWPSRGHACFLAVILCGGIVAGASASERFLVEMWDVERGLPSSTVTGLAQAPDGYLWLSTLNGLARFDGVRFKTFVGPWAAGVKIGGFNRIALGHSGQIWALAEDGELAFRDGTAFSTWKPPSREEAVRSLYAASGGGVWATLANNALARCNDGGVEVVSGSGEAGGLSGPPALVKEGVEWLVTSGGALLEWKAGKLTPRHPPGAETQHVAAVASDGSGSAWVLSENSLSQWRDEQWTPVALPPGSSAPFSGVLCGRDRSLWLWNEQQLWRLGSGKWTPGRVPEHWLKGFHPVGQMVDADGRAWFATRSQGLLAVNATGEATVLSVREGLPSNEIQCLALDHEGNRWAGTARGLVRLKPKQLSVISWENPQGEMMATGIAEGRDGELWIGTYGDGLLRFDPAQEGSLARSAFPAPKSCRALVMDQHEQLWTGTAQEGLWALREGNLDPVREAQLPQGEARSLLADAKGRMWIGTTKGLFVWENGHLSTRRPPAEFGTLDVRALLERKDGSIWVGTQNEGLLRLSDDAWERVPPAPPAELSSVWSLYQDEEGDLWIGTQGGGLARWRRDRLEAFSTTNGLSAATICSILEDDQRSLWLGTYQGIFRLKKSDCDAFVAGRLNRLEPRLLTQSDGMPTLQCTGSFQPTACKTRDGRLCFPTIKGVVVVDPKSATPAGPPPAVVIEEVMLPEGPAQLQPDLPLGPKLRRIEFRFTALSFTAPERVRFRYRLEGEDKEWIEAGTERSAVFNGLAPGAHEFRVIACSADGVWNEQGASLAFTVVPAWWQRRWLQLGAIAGAMVAAGGLWRRAEKRRLERRLEAAKRQGALERERARIAQDIHDELGTSLTRIIMLSQPSDGEGNQAEPSLSKIHETARSLTHAMDEVVWAVNPRQDTLEGLISYASVFTQDFLSHARLGCRLDLPEKLPFVALSAEVRHNVFLAIKEAIHNAVRHAQAREVRLGLRVEDNGFTLEIADDGGGFDPQSAPPGKNGATSRVGHGLQNMKARMEALGGRCDILSEPGKGTTVRLVVPLAAPVAVM